MEDSMELDDMRFENFLREFQPRRPRGLLEVVQGKPKWQRPAAAAMVFAAIGASTWFAVHKTQSRGGQGVDRANDGLNAKSGTVRRSLFSLTKLAVEDPSRLDTELTDQSGRVLPDFRNKESMLRVLSNQ